MNRNCAVIAFVTVVGLFAFTAQSDELKQVTSAVDRPFTDLRATLREAYRLRLAEYKEGRSTPANIIRVNTELYANERGTMIVGRETEAQENYLKRSREIEAIAGVMATAGTGSKPDQLDAIAGRLRAELALHEATRSR